MKNWQQNLSDYLRAIGYQKESQKTILRACLQYDNWLKKPLELSSRADIKSYHDYLDNRPNLRTQGGLSSKMIRDYLWAIALLFKLLEQQDLILKNPLSGYPLPKVRNEKREVLSLEEIYQLYAIIETLKEAVILHLFYGLGLRRSEGEALNLEDIDFKNNWLIVHKGKGGKGRNIPLTPSIKNDLKNYVLTERKKVQHPAFLLNRNHQRLRGASALLILKKLLHRAKIEKKIDLHCLRHSIATHLIHKGMPLEQVRDYLGHSHLESTQKYVHYDPTKLSL